MILVAGRSGSTSDIFFTEKGAEDSAGTYEEYLEWRRERGMKSFIE